MSFVFLLFFFTQSILYMLMLKVSWFMSDANRTNFALASLFIVSRLLQVLLSPFSPHNIQQSLFHRKGENAWSVLDTHKAFGGVRRFACADLLKKQYLYILITLSSHPLVDDEGSCFSFLRFIDVSPTEMFNLMLQGTLVRWVPFLNRWNMLWKRVLLHCPVVHS